MKIYVVTENIPYEGSEVIHVTTDRDECFGVLSERDICYCEVWVWEDGKKVSEIKYDFFSKNWKES